MKYQLFYLSVMYLAMGKITTGDQTDTELKTEENNNDDKDGVCENIQPTWTDIFLPLQKPKEKRGILDTFIRSINAEIGTKADDQQPQVCDMVREENIQEQEDDSDDDSDDSDDESSDDDSDESSS